MTTKTILCCICTLILFLPSCIKDTSNDDLTTSIVGHYTNIAKHSDIVVSKIDNRTVSITLSTGTGSSSYDVAFTTVTMNTAKTFTLNEVTQDGSSCIGTEKFTGNGAFSGKNISLFLTVEGAGSSFITRYDCSGTELRTLTATKI